MKRIFWLIALSLSLSFSVPAQSDLQVYPTHWWTGMKNPQLQLLLHTRNIGHSAVSARINYKGVQLRDLRRLQNPNYLFLDLTISAAARPGQITIELLDGNNKTVRRVEYGLKAKNTASGVNQGVTAADVIYLLMPDRFANGNPANDRISTYRDTLVNRSIGWVRHGGDLEGVEQHLDYLKDLGITSIWMTPVNENNMPLMQEGRFQMAGYHGYWFTDHYQVDKRFGGNEAYHHLIDAAHAKGMKIIQDAVYNHVGSYHWMVLDPPDSTWLNQWPVYTPPNHREESVFDQNGSPLEKQNMLAGWFVPHLPDLNLANPYVATYMIQQAIWWTEEFGIDGWRVDTYKYCDEVFLNTVNNALVREFPRITVFGEAWSNTVTGSAYFAENNMKTPFRHNLQGVTDFPLAFALHAGMTQPFGWTEGVNRIYMTMAQDFLYKDPRRNCLFLDNHDMDRVYSVVGEDWNKLKMGLTWLLTLKEIPQLYYGTEILMKNFKNPNDAAVREDFPGGWPGDNANKFRKEGRTPKEQEAFSYISRLAHYRQQSDALGKGKMMQYIPRNGLYVYFRYTDHSCVMVAANTGSQSQKIDWSYYRERTAGYSGVKNVITGQLSGPDELALEPGTCAVWELTHN